jgi:hypothetical protein
MMSKIDTAKTENDRTAPVLQDDELDAVSGGARDNNPFTLD